MIPLNTSLTTLISFNTSELFKFSVKLLNFPADGTHQSCAIWWILSGVIGDNLVRAVFINHYSEQLHFVIFRKGMYFNQFAILLLLVSPS